MVLNYIQSLSSSSSLVFGLYIGPATAAAVCRFGCIPIFVFDLLNLPYPLGTQTTLMMMNVCNDNLLLFVSCFSVDVWMCVCVVLRRQLLEKRVGFKAKPTKVLNQAKGGRIKSLFWYY